MSTPLVIRPNVPEDTSFILDSFRRSYCQSAFAEGATWQFLASHMTHLIDSWRTLVACTEDSPDIVLGWLVYRDSKTAGYAVTRKGPYQRKGVCKALLKHAGIRPELGVDVVFLNTRFWHAGWALRFRPYLGMA